MAVVAAIPPLAGLRARSPRPSRPTVAILDIRDAEGFVQATLNRWQASTRDRGRIELSEYEREELAAEGLAILFRLREQFRPRLDGYAQDGRFSGYAAQFLPRKLGDAWHRMHEEHQLVVDPQTGKRRWQYGERAMSLEAMTADDPDRHPALASEGELTDLRARLHAALLKRARGERDQVVAVAKRVGAGLAPTAVATELGLTEEQVRRYMRAIVRAAPEPRHQFRTVSELREALDAQSSKDAEIAARVGELLGDGAKPADIAAMLEIEPGEVRDHEEAIRASWHLAEGGDR